jgi:hypothetical protein
MNIILALECSLEKAKKKRNRQQYWMKEWFKKRVTFSNQNLLQEQLVSSQVDYNNFISMEHSTFLELLHMVLYQRFDSNSDILCNLTTHNPNELRNSRVAQNISEQF